MNTPIRKLGGIVAFSAIVYFTILLADLVIEGQILVLILLLKILFPIGLIIYFGSIMSGTNSSVEFLGLGAILLGILISLYALGSSQTVCTPVATPEMYDPLTDVEIANKEPIGPDPSTPRLLIYTSKCVWTIHLPNLFEGLLVSFFGVGLTGLCRWRTE